jgi:chemotaxis protein MotB
VNPVIYPLNCVTNDHKHSPTFVTIIRNHSFKKFKMKLILKVIVFLFFGLSITSCVAKKKFVALQSRLDVSNKELEVANRDLGTCGVNLNGYMAKLSTCENEKTKLRNDMSISQANWEEQIKDLKDQRNKQQNQVGSLTNLSQSATDNIRETLSQLEKKEKYIYLLQAAKTKADSMNLALSVNLKGVLKEGIEDTDIEIKVDKQVVFVNLSDKMLFQQGSSTLTSKANEVLGKIAKLVESRPDLEIMVEGYTDNKPIKTTCMDDNWDLSVKRATSVVRVLQNTYKVNPNRLIAAGRGEYNTLAVNDSDAGRAMNRRTRIIILPKIDQFYDLLNPNKVPK